MPGNRSMVERSCRRNILSHPAAENKTLSSIADRPVRLLPRGSDTQPRPVRQSNRAKRSA